jgi:hypothetical protein
MKNIYTVLALVLAILIASGVVLQSCKESPVSKSARVDSVLVERHDTLIKLDTILKRKIEYIKTAPETLIVKEFERVYYTPEETTKVVTTIGAERKALIVKDSLTWCMACRTVDSVAIDSLSKIAKEKPSQSIDYKGYGLAVGAGVVLGIILTR